MNLRRVVIVAGLTVMLGGIGIAQTNESQVQDAKVQAKQNEKADKAQAKADKDTRKALDSKKVKKAAKSQDKADREAESSQATSISH